MHCRNFAHKQLHFFSKDYILTVHAQQDVSVHGPISVAPQDGLHHSRSNRGNTRSNLRGCGVRSITTETRLLHSLCQMYCSELHAPGWSMDSFLAEYAPFLPTYIARICTVPRYTRKHRVMEKQRGFGCQLVVEFSYLNQLQPLCSQNSISFMSFTTIGHSGSSAPCSSRWCTLPERPAPGKC